MHNRLEKTRKEHTRTLWSLVLFAHFYGKQYIILFSLYYLGLKSGQKGYMKWFYFWFPRLNSKPILIPEILDSGKITQPNFKLEFNIGFSICFLILTINLEFNKDYINFIYRERGWAPFIPIQKFCPRTPKVAYIQCGEKKPNKKSVVKYQSKKEKRCIIKE